MGIQTRCLCPFPPVLLPPRYATMLANKMDSHGTTAWLVNTGWTGGK